MFLGLMNVEVEEEAEVEIDLEVTKEDIEDPRKISLIIYLLVVQDHLLGEITDREADLTEKIANLETWKKVVALSVDKEVTSRETVLKSEAREDQDHHLKEEREWMTEEERARVIPLQEAEARTEAEAEEREEEAQVAEKAAEAHLARKATLLREITLKRLRNESV